MTSWKEWYSNYTQAKLDNNLKAFAAGLKGEKYEPKLKPRFDYTSSWSELLSIAKSTDDFQIIEFKFDDRQIVTDNSLLSVCIQKAIKNNANYGNNLVLSYLIFNFLNSLKINNPIDLIKAIREIPEEIFINCNNCGTTNEPGWINCSNCKISIDNSFDD